MPYCKVCGYERESFKEILKHALSLHPDSLGEYWRSKYQEWLEREWSCSDCTHAGNVYYDEFDERGGLKKACPGGYLWNHPNPADGCKSFVPHERYG